MSENLNQWFDVAANSKLRVSVAAKSGSTVNFITYARVVPTTGSEKQWEDHEIHPGPKVLTIKENTSYAVRVAVKFLATMRETAVFTAKVLDPSGRPHADWWGNNEYVLEVTGKAGDRRSRLTLILVEDQS